LFTNHLLPAEQSQAGDPFPGDALGAPDHADVLALSQYDVPGIGSCSAQQVIEWIARCRHGSVMKSSGTVAA
jgi:hypothetical protein